MNNSLIKKFIPLITIFFLIASFTLVRQLISNTWHIKPMMLDFMGAFFIVFGAFKIINLNNFAKAYAMYDLIAKQSKTYAFAYPFIELTLGVCYLWRCALVLTNWVTLIIMLVSAAGVARELYKGNQITCACLGLVFKFPMTYVTLAEDLLMALMAATMLYL
jgi:hypothetical protein